METTLLNYETCRRFAHPKRIAMATDLTDGDVLLPYAISQARVTGAHLTLIHALNSHPVSQQESWLTHEEDLKDELDAIDKLEDMQRAAHTRGVCCSIRLNRGEPKKVILDALRHSHSDRLIVGSHGRRHLREVLHGSVAKEIMASVTIPTLFIGPHVHPPADIRTRQILCLLSIEGEYEKVARFALLLGEMHQAHVKLMHVLDNAEAINPARSEEWARSVLQGLIDRFGRRVKQASVEVRHGGLVDVAEKATQEQQSDVLVLGTCFSSHPSRLKDLLAYQTIATVACPVYCYRVDPTEQPSEKLEQYALPAWS